ncbi:hypothetical protein ACN28S_26380 [Cystobacter fuscus]
MNALAYPSAVVADLARAIGMQMADEAVAPSWKAEVLAARRGDPSAFESLVRGMQRPVYGLALRLLGNEAEPRGVARGLPARLSAPAQVRRVPPF